VLDPLRASTPPPPAAAADMGDSDFIAASPAESSDARHGGLPNCIIISNTSEDGGVDTTCNLQEVSVPDTSDEFDEDEETVNPKKKQKKTMI